MSGKRIELIKETSHFLLQQVGPSLHCTALYLLPCLLPAQHGGPTSPRRACSKPACQPLPCAPPLVCNHVQQVTKDDYLCFVSYSNEVTMLCPLVRMTPHAKAFAHTVIEALEADGGTALFDGTVAGMKQQLGSELGADDARKSKAVFLCTDGEANVGPQTSDDILPRLHEVCKQHGGRPCTIHTFGIGNGHCAQLLQVREEELLLAFWGFATSPALPWIENSCFFVMLLPRLL